MTWTGGSPGPIQAGDPESQTWSVTAGVKEGWAYDNEGQCIGIGENTVRKEREVQRHALMTTHCDVEGTGHNELPLSQQHEDEAEGN